MLLLILIGIVLVLFGGFLLLTAYERTHARVCARMLARLDRLAGRALFIVKHVDWSGFVKHMTRSGTERVLHDLAHGVLVVVRFLERSLTRLVRVLRERRAGILTVHSDGVARKSIRETIRTFRKTLTAKGKAQDKK